MNETPEGLAGRKWSFLEEPDGLYVMQGNRKIARVEDRSAMALLVTAPEFYDAVNEWLPTASHEPIGNTTATRLAQVLEKAKGVRNAQTAKEREG